MLPCQLAMVLCCLLQLKDVQTIGCINCGNSQSKSGSVSGSSSTSQSTSNSKTSQGVDVNGIFQTVFGGGRKMVSTDTVT